MRSSTPADGTTVTDARLEALALECPDCEVPMRGTGHMTWSVLSRRWLVAYWCPQHRGVVSRWGEDVAALVGDVAARAGWAGDDVAS